ncbi:MAG: DNA gyrase subunit A [Muribaculaceae bacterium]
MNNDRIQKINIENQMRSAYIDYSMSVIVSRALPDVRDGFKPVHRRVLYGMEKLGNFSTAPYKKSARIVGDVLGKFHPHGDSSVYYAMVRMAQNWAMRYTLVDGQGNFGSVDGDGAAAMRYTEARLAKMGEEMMRDIDADTVDFTMNFDNTIPEPTVMPTRFPNLLVNGASGIAVGMATNMPPHNLTESINACIAMENNPDITVPELMQYIKAPDFPTGGIIYGLSGVKEAFETGRGRIVVRAKTEIEVEGEHERIIITEIPYNVNKRLLIMKIADLVNEKRIDGISNVNDESDRKGMRIVVDVRRDSNAQIVLNKLFKMTELQSSFSVNNIALVNGRPKTLNLKEILYHFLQFRHDVVIRRTKFELKKAEARAHIVQGLIIASDNIDEVIKIIKTSANIDEAKSRLCERFGLDEEQANAIVQMRLRQLTNLEQGKLREEYEELQKLIAHLNLILTDPEECKKVIIGELEEIRDKYGDERKTDIRPDESDFSVEDMYANEPAVITISHNGYIKRTPLAEFRAQNRGGVGVKGSDTRDDDFIEHIYPATLHNYMLFFTQKGRCYWMRVFEIHEGARNSKGRAIQNMLNIEPDDKITAFIRVESFSDPDYNKSHNIVFCTKRGTVKKTSLADYSRPRAKGIIAINILEGDSVIDVVMTNGNSQIILADKKGRAIRFSENTVRVMGRNATGVKGMALTPDDEIIGMICVDENKPNDILVVSENGYGKRSALEDYRITNRGGKGVKTLNVTDKTGELIAIKDVNDDNDIVIINKSGITIRLNVENLRVMGRATQGVKLINLEKRHDMISSVCKVDSDKVDEEDLQQEGSTDAVDVDAEQPINQNETDVDLNETED